MNQKNKKIKQPQGNLIALGNNNKARNALPLQTIVKKAKTDDLNPKTLITTIEQTIKQENGNCETTLINFLNSVKMVLITSNKPIKTYLSQCLALFAVCKKFPSLFTKVPVVECLVNILSYNGKDSSNATGLPGAYKPQPSMSINPATVSKIKPLHIAVCNILLYSFRDSTKWPTQLFKAYLEDSSGDRVWVDLPECYLFVLNIETAFPSPGIDPRTLFPLSAFSESLIDILNTNDVSNTTATQTESAMDHCELKSCGVYNKILTGLSGSGSVDEFVKPRFEAHRVAIEAMITAFLKEIVERRFMADTQARPIIRTFSSLAGLPDVRSAAVMKSDNWLSTGKLQSSTLNMLTIMASSCTQGIHHNPSDTNFCVYLTLKFKYKVSKPPVQTSLLECIRKVAESNPHNLRTLLEIYVNNEIYGSPTVASGTTINSANVGVPAIPAVYSSQNKVGPVSVTFPAVFFRYPTESNKILGELLHEQICVLHNDIKPVKLFIRDACRWIKIAHLNSSGVYSMLAGTGGLPDCLELHDLAQTLLTDRSGNDAFNSRMTDHNFKQLYVENMISIVCELQMLSVIRPNVRDSFRDRGDQEKKDFEALKNHYNTVRQIRYFTCKWLKNIFRLIESHVTADQMTHYIKQALFLNVTRNNDFSYVVDESYGIGDIWNTETDKMQLIKGLTEVPISDKLIQTLINLGFEKHLCFRPSEIVNMISELIIRASASASSDITAMSLSKGESIINNMFACCSYDVALEENDPNLQIARTLAYKSSFWKVSQALVIIATHCPNTCGAYLWNNFPTVRNLMKIIITSNFDEFCNDKDAMEAERQFCETDAKKICELETKLIEANGEEAPIIDANNSKLVNLLLFNLPQGPIRQPPAHMIESLKSINVIMKIGDRLSQCRNPDFLFEIVREQDQSKISSRKWIIDLVKKTSEQNLDCLPLLCLTEFIYHDLYEKITNGLPIVSKNDTKDMSLKRLVNKIRLLLCGNDSDLKNSIVKENLKQIVGALSNSFFNRLSDSSAFIRMVARECLFILLQPLTSPIKLMDSSSQFVDTLKTIMNLNILQDNAVICSVAEALRETLKFETDIDVLHSYIDLFALMSSGNHKEWLANIVETLSILILNRPIIAEKLKSHDYETLSKGKASASLISDSLAEIYFSHITYTAYQETIVPLEHRDVPVMVNLKDKQFPAVVKVIQSQLALLCWGVSKSKKMKKLIDFWFYKVNNKFQLTNFSSVEQNGSVPEVIPEWLVNAAVNSGVTPVMLGILHHHLHINKTISHSLTPALYFMPNDFIKAYLNFINSIIKSDVSLVISWLSQGTNRINSVLTTVTKMYSKVKGVDSTFRTTIESLISPNKDCSEKVNMEPKVIVKPIEKPLPEHNDDVMEVDADRDKIWNSVIQAYSCDQKNLSSTRVISDAIGSLLSMKSDEILRSIENLFKLLKDSKTHSETLRVLNKADFRLMPLLKLIFRSYDQNSFEYGMRSFNYLFNSYPHIEKSTLWKVIYNLSLVQGLTVANESMDVIEDDQSTQPGYLKYPTVVKSLAKSIMQGNVEDAAKIGPKIDKLTILGLGNVQFSESHFDMIHKLLFSSHSLNQYSDYFMSDLLHQSNVYCLRQILHSILNRKTISQINASRVLDFITACLNHPRLQFSVALPTSNRHIWPQQNLEIDLTEFEFINLLNLVVSETEHLIEQNGPNAKCVNKCLNKRTNLIDICSSSEKLQKDRYTIINRFIESKSHNPTIEKFSFALYSRIPNLIVNNSAINYGKDVLANPEASVSNVECYSIKEIHSIGQRLLAGLVNPRNDLQDIAIQACKALVTKHPKLCIQLLPYMCALSDGALDGSYSWNEFRKKRGQVLYSNLLHLLEIMIPYSLSVEKSIRSNTKKILFNCLRVLIRYRDEHKFFIGFVGRLVNFMEKLIPLEPIAEELSEDTDDFIIEHSSEITALSKIYPQFRSLIVYVQKNKEICSTLLLNSSINDIADDNNRISQLPVLKLDLLVNFRRKLREIQNGNGILVQIKDLEDVSRRDTNIIGLFLDDLRSLINHAMSDVRLSTVQILARYLNSFPDQATRIIGDCILPNMLMSSSWYWSKPFANLCLKTLCQTGMLAPNVVPNCLTNHARLFVSGHNGRGNYRESIELLEIVIDNLSLESFMELSVAGYNTSSKQPLPSSHSVQLKKDTAAATQKRHYQDIGGEGGDGHRVVKRSRFK